MTTKKAPVKTNGQRNAERNVARVKAVERAKEMYAEEAERGKTVLDHAAEAVNGSRQENYGDQHTNFTNIADIWTVILREKLIAPLTPQEVAMMQIGLKLARLTKTGGMHHDSIVDVAGYALCLEQVNRLSTSPSL